MEYKIRVKTLEGRFLTFNNVKEYSLKGGLISFLDVKTGRLKRFGVNNVEVERMGELG